MTRKKELKSSFEGRLNELFENSTYSKSSLAKALNVTHTTVSRWLSGQIPKGDSLFGLASLMGVNVQWLLTEEGEKEPGNLQDIQKPTEKNTSFEQLEKETVSLLNALVLAESNQYTLTLIAHFLQTNKPEGYESLLDTALSKARAAINEEIHQEEY